jgi:hypothetical protein
LASTLVQLKNKRNNIKMKSILFYLSVIILTFSSCSKDDDAKSTTQINSNVQSGTWRITKYIDSQVDETSKFAGYNFTFQSNGIVYATKGSVNYTGAWSITDSNSNDDSQDDLDFNLYFDLTNDFEDLNDNWDFISQSANKIELLDVSGGSGETDYLTFEKN